MKPIQPILLLILVVATSVAHAVPVMNENASVSRSTTIFPDHADPSVFYIAPNFLSLCADTSGVPRFSYQDIHSKSGMHGIAQMTFCPKYFDDDLLAAKTALLAKVSNARFVALPFTSSKLKFDTVLEPFIVKEFCSHTAGMVGDEQACSFRLNTAGRRIFITKVRDRLSMTMQYEYTVAGFIRTPTGTFDSQVTTYGIAVRAGGDELKAHPELFSDVNGRPLKAR